MCKKVLAFSLLALPALANADVYFTAGGAFGSVDMGALEETYGSGFETTDDVRRAVVGLGVEVNKFIALEGVYMTSVDAEVTNGFDKDELSHSGIQLAMLAKAPVTQQFSLYAKLSLNALSTEYDYSNPAGTISAHGEDSGSYLGFGLGMQYRINDNAGFRLGVERMQIKDVTVLDANYDPESVDFDVDQATLALDFHF